MRVIHVSCIAPPEHGGIGRVAAREVASLRERGIEADVVSMTTHHAFRFGNAGRITALQHLVRDADIVHVHYPFFGTAELLPSLKRKGLIKRLVITLHMDATARGWKGAIFSAYRHLFQNRILAAADVLLASSRDYVERSSFRNVANRVVELPFGVDVTRFSPGASERDRFGIPQGAPLVLFVGGMDSAHAFKGVPELLRAMADLPDAHLLLVGEGGLRPSYERLARDLGMTARCHFVGAQKDDALIAAYRSADVLAFPSLSAAEAFGLVAVEAQACGTPVIASNLPGVRTVVADGETGILVPAGDVKALHFALVRILSDRTLRNRLSSAARDRVETRFAWTTHMDGLVEVYQRMMEKI
jgi:glycosyltransferase involved in cell wall biosynthesis